MSLHTVTIDDKERDLLIKLLNREYDHISKTFGALPAGQALQQETQALYTKLWSHEKRERIRPRGDHAWACHQS